MKRGSSPKQYAYATRRLSGGGKTKQEIALLSGYSSTVAKNASNKIEKTEGYQNAVLELANESNNIALAILTEYKLRGIKDFSNKELNGALNAISVAWDRFDKKRAMSVNKNPETNPLRKVMMQRVENQTVNINTGAVPEEERTVIDVEPVEEEKVDLDF